MVSTLLAWAILFLVGATPSLAQTTTEGGMTIQTSTVPGPTTSVVVVTTAITTVTETGVMSVPGGETPISSTPIFSGNGTVTSTVTHSGSASSSVALSTSGKPSQTGNAAPGGHMSGHGDAALLAMAVSGLSVTLGFAWALL